MPERSVPAGLFPRAPEATEPLLELQNLRKD